MLIPQLNSDVVLADKAYDAEKRVIKGLLDKGKQPVIPSKSNRLYPRAFDKHLYRSRHLVENLFAKLKQYRSIATRFDKLSQVFLSAVYMVGAVIWLI